MSLTKTTFSMIASAPVNVRDMGAVGDSKTDDSSAFQAAIDKAIATTGEVFVPAGEYVLASTVTIPYIGGVKIRGTSPNSLGTKSRIFQKSVEIPAFTVNAINVTMVGLTFTVWAGNITDANNNPITCVSVTSNSMTLSADPWPNQSPVIWNVTTPLISTDGTPYSTVLQMAIMGAFYASGVTKNGNGTVTLTGVKGANGTVNAQLASIVGASVERFTSLAHASVAPTNPNAASIYLAVKENHFYDQLWFNQVANAFTLSALGSGSGPGVGVGNVGFMSNICCDQAQYFVKGLGDINNVQIVNSLFSGVVNSFYAPSGNITSSTFSNNKVEIGKFIEANGDIYGCTIVGNNFNAIDGYGYSDYLISNGGTIRATTIVGNNFGRSLNTCINTSGFLASNFSGNNITSNSEGGSQPWLYVSNDILNSTLADNNFAGLFASITNRLGFVSATPSVSGSSFGGEWIGYQTGTKVIGWLAPTFQNSWVNVGGGTEPVQYFKDQNGVVYIKGQTVGGLSGTVVFTLPAGYRPQGLVRAIGVTSIGPTIMPVEIATNGEVSILTSVALWGSFNTISFPTR